MKYQKVSLLVFFLFCSVWSFSQSTIPKKPDFIPAVIDSTNSLTKSEFNSLSRKLEIYSDSTSTEILLLIIPSTNGEEIKFYAAQLGEKWEIGQKEKDNGVVILMAKDDRKITIQTGYGIEHLLTDALSRRIIENIILPEFKQGNYYKGLDKGSDVVFQILSGEYTGEPKDNTVSGFPLESLLPFIIFFVILIILSRRNNKGGGRNGGKRSGGLDLWDIIILSNMGRSGHSGGGFGDGGNFGGGGGFGGFGSGGGFGGGGASGGW